ncbi:coiled-coil domain-containing protein [Arabiibacter massiliensis]|uniref:coiled-coil domain-containing protein n=1 Tax=Arabiibacter massiliensis TaxID=1870985 RepID=UPI001E62075A|nr:hypothetical protein [Arabiibacter massiliensis]
MTSSMSTKRTMRAAAAALLAGMLALALALALAPAAGAAPLAWADEAEDAQAAADEAQSAVEEAQAAVEGAQSELEGAKAQAGAAASDYEALKQEIDELQARIDETTAQAMDAQAEVLEGRTSLARSVSYQYLKGDSVQSLIALLLESESLSDLLRDLAYLDAVARYQADEVEAQKARTERFDALVADLNAQKDAQDEKLQELEAKKAEADQAVAAASTSLESAQGEHAEQSSRLEELIRKAEEAAAAGEAAEPVAVEESNTNTARPGDQQTEVKPEPAPDGGGSSDAGGVGWSTGIASAYGGSTDPYTPNPGTTATGAVCDDNSMGVAVPMAWPRYWQYYGRTVEISYNGMTVFATVNDCGGMGGGSRSLDLQPGVWKAFGYSSCTDWGLRTVNYRFL